MMRLGKNSSNEWETPFEFFNTLHTEFHFTIDVCATEENKKLHNYYSPQDNGLLKEWKGTCWMNPPYSKEIGRWIGKAWESAQGGATVVALIQGRSVDTIWFHKYVMHSSEIRIIRDRLHFGLNGVFSRANFPSMVIIFKPYCQGPPTICSINTKGIQLFPEKRS